MSIGHFQSQPGGPIFAGLRRAFGEPGRTKPAAERTGYAGVDQADRQSAGAQPLAPNLSLASPNVRAAAEPTPRPGGIAGDLARRGRAGSDWTIRLAANRAIAPNSLTGVSLLLGLCAAAWLSGGTGQDDVRGLITTGTWVVMRAAATRLSSATARRAGRSGQVGRGRQLQPDRSDWMVLPGFDWSGEEPPKRPGVGRPGFRQPHLRQPHLRQHSTGLAREREFGWFYAVCATAGESAIYGGIAAGAESAGWTATWPLAVAIVIVGSIAAIPRACGSAAALAGFRRRKTTRVFGTLAALTFPPIGGRVLLATLIVVGYGPRIALVVVLAAGTVSLVRTLIETGGLMAAVRRAAAASSAGRAATSVVYDVVVACRDDGPLARRAGWLVRGNLMPVPPATAGLVAIGLLTALGIRSLPGIVALTPVVVLLLAAPGSSHPHDGRSDWLVPVLLCVAQYLYLAVLGAAGSVSWLVVYTACSMTAIWYASLTASRARATPPPARTRLSRRTRVSQIMARRTEGIGWEGRVGLVSVAGMFGIATFGYLGLTACLGVLICQKMISDYLGEDRRQ